MKYRYNPRVSQPDEMMFAMQNPITINEVHDDDLVIVEKITREMKKAGFTPFFGRRPDGTFTAMTQPEFEFD